ncbi:glycoside hydrolase family 5 protein [Melanomma pulvis-pyrius CBS 109.77]|uniref:Glycoside hydrolase family 5 protein n=1 Tax=Melanomma pulvis-pyrius CBS 109.77 TaxID=1314802 RepID=A0A6A6XQJ8_9PLEO|nr:glycoside hydrolase family 5 protein [Melanomma pulvis-pyrius CBS 109.77]
MLGSWILLISTLAGTVASDYARETPKDAHFRDLLRKRVENGTSFNAPYKTRGRDIVDSRGQKITWAGVNWPLSGETMVPEGLEWASAEEILDEIASVGFNYIRMGYAIEMIDQVYDRNGVDVPLEVAMINALGYVNGTKVTNEIVAKNPGWTSQTTRFEIWSDVTRIAATKGIFISPDVHIGKAQWCCSHTDGNAWFDDLQFPAETWRRGLAYIATWAKDHPNIVSMSLRNELRESYNVTSLQYNWQTLVGNMTEGADAIHEANPDILILWSGMQYAQDLSALTAGSNFLTAPCYKCTAIRDAHRRAPEYFNLEDHPWSDKVVWEIHLYSMSEDQDTGTCSIIQASLYRNGFNALGIKAPASCNITGDCPKAVRETPVILSEFGGAQDVTLFNHTLNNCLRNFTVEHDVSWMMWSIAGSYRIRSGAQGVADTWALGNAEWNGWNYKKGIDEWWKPWVQAMNTTSIG